VVKLVSVHRKFKDNLVGGQDSVSLPY